MKIINNLDKAPKAVGTYSQAALVGGVYYFSGQIGLDPETMTLKEGFQAQLDQVMSNIDACLEESGLTRQNIFKTTIFLKDLGNFSKVNEAYINFFSAPFPARSCVEASALPKGALVEIEVMATRG